MTMYDDVILGRITTGTMLPLNLPKPFLGDGTTLKPEGWKHQVERNEGGRETALRPWCSLMAALIQ